MALIGLLAWYINLARNTMAVTKGIMKSSVKLQEKLNKRKHLCLKLWADAAREGQHGTDPAALTAAAPAEVICCDRLQWMHRCSRNICCRGDRETHGEPNPAANPSRCCEGWRRPAGGRCLALKGSWGPQGVCWASEGSLWAKRPPASSAPATYTKGGFLPPSCKLAEMGRLAFSKGNSCFLKGAGAVRLMRQVSSTASSTTRTTSPTTLPLLQPVRAGSLLLFFIT